MGRSKHHHYKSRKDLSLKSRHGAPVREGHLKLNKKFFEKGSLIVVSKGRGKKIIVRLSKLRPHQSFFENYFKGNIPDAKFGQVYRSLWKNMDELVSTATMREVTRGFKKTYDKSSLQDKELIIENLTKLSMLRMSTRNVGYSLKDSSMQHPTKDGLFADPKKTASQHSNLDLERRNFVLDSMERGIAAGENITQIFGRMQETAIRFTTNYMAAPIVAKNVQPFSLKEQASLSELKPFNDEREKIKSLSNSYTHDDSKIIVHGDL